MTNKHDDCKYKRLINIGIAILIIGMLFSIEHLPFGYQIITLGFVIISIFYFLHFLIKKSKQFIDYVKLILVFLWSINGLLKTHHLLYTPIVSRLFVIFIIVWVMLELSDLGSNNKIQKLKEKSSILKWLVVICITGEMIFQIQHWQGRILLSFCGLFLTYFWLNNSKKSR